MFAFRIEREEGEDDQSYVDPFVEEGEMTTSSESHTSMSEDPDSDGAREELARSRGESLSAARKFRSMLKHKLLRALKRRYRARMQ